MLTAVPDLSAALPAGEASPSVIDQIVREGAWQVPAAALQAEVAYIDQFAGVRDENGRRLVVRNGAAEPRTVLTSAGAMEVTAPRVNDKRTGPATGERMRFSSALLPPWARKTLQVTRCCRCCICMGCLVVTSPRRWAQFLGTGAGLSASVITKLPDLTVARYRTTADEPGRLAGSFLGNGRGVSPPEAG